MAMRRMALQMGTRGPIAPRMDDLPVRRKTTARKPSVISLPLASPISDVQAGAFWRDYATTRKDFESTQSELDTLSASLDLSFRELTGSSSAESESSSLGDGA